MVCIKARDGEVVVIDVRPWTEYEQAHLPFARGFRVRKMLSGVSKWQAAGLPVQGISPLQQGGRP